MLFWVPPSSIAGRTTKQGAVDYLETSTSVQGLTLFKIVGMFVVFERSIYALYFRCFFFGLYESLFSAGAGSDVVNIELSED